MRLRKPAKKKPLDGDEKAGKLYLRSNDEGSFKDTGKETP
jgi:hypothetical protein